MEALSGLAQGLAVAAQPANLLYAFDRRVPRHRGRRAARHRPGAHRRAAAAGHLQARSRPARSSCSPASITAACMAARPPRSCSTRRARARRWRPRSKATRWPRPAAAGRRSRRPPSARSSRAGIGTLALAFLAPWIVELALLFGPEDYFALMCVAFVTVSATFGASPLRGLTSLALGLTLGLVGIDKLTGQARLTSACPSCSTASR
jgi:hypothetical protein